MHVIITTCGLNLITVGTVVCSLGTVKLIIYCLFDVSVNSSPSTVKQDKGTERVCESD